MNNKDITGKEVKARIIRLRLVDGTHVNGQININREQGYDRLSDLIANDRDLFLILYNVMVHHGNIDNPTKHKTLFINKDHILWAEPDEDQK
ncbi:MAG: hypothetical protein K8S13_25325 [Desulfobacula sp.]|uniref:DUF6812 domain-containing protein n=1 Tax=Desulfobacula sp. TaxID=2593537 RepID=UPI0025C68819|nr:hypothetical protein [Desulfobacula sp.]MCD4723152.1 hypothetical protein [Desulfobacula sp.]